MKKREAITLVFLIGLGAMQIAADTMGLPQVKGLAAALQVSPSMKVFTAHNGYETHAARFELHWLDNAGEAQSMAIDPASYANVAGPYNRRNVYGAAFAYGPLLRADLSLRPMQESVMRYAFCRPGNLRADLGIPVDATQLTAHVVPVHETNRKDLELIWEVSCHE